ncbi:MAG: hypothetical protein KJ606_02795 [Chloroflexi bacterium]|nr:hypothetical protein [Chloroflexota bacterium]
MDIAAMSLALTARSVVGGLGPFAASVADSRGRRFGMLLGLGLFTLGTALVVFWPTFPALALTLILTTLGKYLFDSSMHAYLGDHVPYERRGLFFFYISFEFTLVTIISLMTQVLPEARATLISFNVASLSLGRALGAPLAPWLYGFGFPAVAAGAVVFNGLALLALRRMGKAGAVKGSAMHI